MTPFALRRGNIPAAKRRLFERLRADFEAMPDLDPADLVSCHAVCRALERRHPGTRCVDGFFHAVGQDHSWLDLGDGIVADMYPVAGAAPFMVDASHWMVPWNQIYQPKPDLLDTGRRDRAHHEGIADQLVAALAEHDLQP